MARRPTIAKIDVRVRRVACPFCEAPAGSPCRSIVTGRPQAHNHPERHRSAAHSH